MSAPPSPPLRIGWKEYLDFPEWGLLGVKVKIDTGARTSAVGALRYELRSGETGMVARIELAPGQRTGLHFHPCPVVGCVLAGEIRFQVEGEAERTLQVGDAFFEPANTQIANFDNNSDSEAAAFVAFYLLPEGEERLIVMAE